MGMKSPPGAGSQNLPSPLMLSRSEEHPAAPPASGQPVARTRAHHNFPVTTAAAPSAKGQLPESQTLSNQLGQRFFQTRQRLRKRRRSFAAFQIPAGIFKFKFKSLDAAGEGCVSSRVSGGDSQQASKRGQNIYGREILLPIWYFVQHTAQYIPCLNATPSALSIPVGI